MFNVVEDFDTHAGLTFLGTDSGFGKNNTSAYKITSRDNKLILIDCGYTVFNKIKELGLLKMVTSVDVIVTHLHPDHAGSLAQLILYCYYETDIPVNITTKCKDIDKFLTIQGCEGLYTREKSLSIEFIRTQHAEDIDSYGFYWVYEDTRIIYTGDTSNFDVFEPYLKEGVNIFLDASCKDNSCHFDFIGNFSRLKKKYKFYLIHTDDKEFLKKFIHYRNADMVKDPEYTNNSVSDFIGKIETMPDDIYYIKN